MRGLTKEERINGSMNEWRVNAWIWDMKNEWKKDCMNERMMGKCLNMRGWRINAWMYEWLVNAWIWENEGWIKGWMCEWMKGRMKGWINEWMNEEWMGECKNEWRMNGRMQKWMRICIKSTLHFKLDFAVQCSKQFSSGQSNLKLIINWGNPDIHSSNMYLDPYSWNNISQNFINKK